MHSLTLSPPSQLVSMKWDRSPIHKLSARLHTKPVEPGCVVPIPLVELYYPLVDRGDLLQPVDVAMWWGPSVWEPAQLRRVQDCAHHQFIQHAGMELVLVVDYLLEVEDAVGDAGHVATLQQVIDAGNQEDPHGCLGPAVVHLPGVLQCGDGCTRNGIPVNVDCVRSPYCTPSGVVKLVKLTVS